MVFDGLETLIISQQFIIESDIKLTESVIKIYLRSTFMENKKTWIKKIKQKLRSVKYYYYRMRPTMPDRRNIRDLDMLHRRTI